MRVAAIVMGVMLFAGCEAENAGQPARDRPTRVDDSPPVRDEPEPADPDPMAQLVAIETYAEALEAMRPSMNDGVDESSPGAIRLALWAAGKLTLGDVRVARNETNIKLVKKDSDAQRGRRMCVNGRIVQIAKQETGLEQPLFVGTMMTNTYDAIHYFAARDTGELVEGSRARLCGVVTGLFSYANVTGGQTHSVEMVGVFDLPQNRTATALR